MRSYMTDHRTPLAWRHRDITLQHNGGHRHQHRPPPSPSVTTTTSSDEREEVPMVRAPPPPHHLRRPNSRGARYHAGGGQSSQFSTVMDHHYPGGGGFREGGGGMPFREGRGTLRSTRSVPAIALATWDGEPCPVHGHGVPLYHHQHGPNHHHPPSHPSNAGTLRRHGSLFDVRFPPYFGHPPHFQPPPMPYPPIPPPPLEKKSFHGSMQMPYMMPPMMRPRPFVFPAGEPLPVRDPYKMRTPPASGYAGSTKVADDAYGVDQVCCKGHLIVLWIILAVVTVGVVLGIVLGVTIA